MIETLHYSLTTHNFVEGVYPQMNALKMEDVKLYFRYIMLHKFQKGLKCDKKKQHTEGLFGSRSSSVDGQKCFGRFRWRQGDFKRNDQPHSE